MLNLNLKNVFTLRNIQNPAGYLKKTGLNYNSSKKYFQGSQRQINLDTIEKLCIQLHCTPNDLFDWQYAGETPNHPMNQLRRNNAVEISNQVQQLPLNKLELLQQWLKDNSENKL